MPHRHLHRRKQSFSNGSTGTFQYARPWQVFLAALLFVGCVFTTMQVAEEFQYMTAQENIEYHVNDLDGVEFEHPQVTSDWGFIRKAVGFVKKVVKGAVRVVKAAGNVIGMYMGIIKCKRQHYPIYPAANPWDLGIVQQANYEKPLKSQGKDFAPIAQRYINRMPFKWARPEKSEVNMQVLDSKVISEWRMLLVRDKRTKYLWICFRGTTSINNWVDNARKFFNFGKSKLNRNLRDMNAQIVRWQRQYQIYPNSPYNRLYGFIGHSAGGWYSNKVATNYDVWRVTLNAYNTKIRSRRHINLRTYRDPVSATDGLNYYACLEYCKKGHGNIDFINCWRGRYHRYSPTRYVDLWHHTYVGFSRKQPNAYRFGRVPNEVVNGRNIDPSAVKYIRQNGRLAIANRGGIGSDAPVVANTRGWTKVFSCSGQGRGYRQRWHMHYRTLISRAKYNYFQYLFVNPRRSTQWAISTEYSNQWQTNVANGKALSYVKNGVNNYQWAAANVFSSLKGGEENFGYSCSNNKHPNIQENIYWACGNGKNGFHVIPVSKICRWSWSGREFSNFAVDLYIKRTGPWSPQGPPKVPIANLKGWRKVYVCSTDENNANFLQRWAVQPRTLIAEAQKHVFAFMFVDPRNPRRWVMMDGKENFFAKNLKAGLALSYNGDGALGQGFIDQEVKASYVSLREHFAFRCSNKGNPRFKNDIYWACGNGKNGFHVIPSSRLCRWSWSSKERNRIALYVKKIGKWC